MSDSFIKERRAAAQNIGLAVVDNGDIGIVIKYNGVAASGLIGVTGNNAITFAVGALAAEIADTNIQVGATPGTIDLANAAADTYGELVDYINSTTGVSGWSAYLQDVLRADATNTAVTNASASQAKLPAGLPVFKKTSTALNLSQLIWQLRYPFGFYSQAISKVARCFGIVSKNTFGGGTNTIQIWEINPVTKTETLVYSRPGAATTVVQALQEIDVDIEAHSGNYLLVRMVGSTTCTGFLTALGQVY